MGNVPVRECRGREFRTKDDFYLFGDNDLEQCPKCPVFGWFGARHLSKYCVKHCGLAGASGGGEDGGSSFLKGASEDAKKPEGGEKAEE